MSFWESLFAGAIAKIIVDYKEENEESKKWNALFDELQGLEDDMSAFLKQAGVPDSLVVLDPDIIKNGNVGISQERRRLATIKSKIREFIAIGGNPQNIGFYEDINTLLNQLKQLKIYNLLDEQDEFFTLDEETFKYALAVSRMIKEEPETFETGRKIYNYADEQETIICKKIENAQGQEYYNLLAAKEYVQKIKSIYKVYTKLTL